MPTNDCCDLKPRTGEKPIPEGTSSDQILAKVQLVCDDDTGIFFYRYNHKLYMRIVDCS